MVLFGKARQFTRAAPSPPRSPRRRGSAGDSPKGRGGGFYESTTRVFAFSFSEDYESCGALSIAAGFEASTWCLLDVFHDFVLICSAADQFQSRAVGFW